MRIYIKIYIIANMLVSQLHDLTLTLGSLSNQNSTFKKSSFDKSSFLSSFSLAWLNSIFSFVSVISLLSKTRSKVKVSL